MLLLFFPYKWVSIRKERGITLEDNKRARVLGMLYKARYVGTCIYAEEKYNVNPLSPSSV